LTFKNGKNKRLAKRAPGRRQNGVAAAMADAHCRPSGWRIIGNAVLPTLIVKTD